MLKIHFLQLWHNLSDPGMEEAIYDRLSFQKFLGFDCFTADIPDETTILRFRHLLEEHDLSGNILEVVNIYLEEKGLILKEGSIVDATIMEAPRSKKNKSKQRDPEMSSTKKNNNYHFGAKGHIGVQANGKPIIHSVEFTTAKDHDKTQMDNLFHGQEKAIFGDSAYTKRDDKRDARKDDLYYGISDRGVRNHPLSNAQKKKNRRHSRLRCKVEHPFLVIKERFKFRKLRFKGIEKNKAHFIKLCALSNIYMCRKQILSAA